MTSLLIRNVDTALHAALKARAAKHHRSLEEEARELLRVALARPETEPGENLVELAQRLFGPEHGVDLDIPPARRSARERAARFPGKRSKQVILALIAATARAHGARWSPAILPISRIAASPS
jgi:plasmid stability protein